MRGQGSGRLGKICDELMALWEDGYNDCEIARKVGCTSNAIKHWRSKNGLARNCKPGNPLSSMRSSDE